MGLSLTGPHVSLKVRLKGQRPQQRPYRDLWGTSIYAPSAYHFNKGGADVLLGPLSAVTRAYESCSFLGNLDGRGRTGAFKTGGWSTTEKRFEDVGS